MDGLHPITYEMFSAVIAAITVVGGAWVFIERRIIGVEKQMINGLETLEKETRIDVKAVMADASLLREKMYREFVQNEQLIRLEERLVNELREMRRSFEKRWNKDHE